jgi:predicted RNA-binding Zn-ribbon protein involved in translation (DUF1610 family)
MSFLEDLTLGPFIAQVMQTKARMLDSPGEKGSFDCPKCGTKVEVRLIGRRNHARAACPTEGCWSMLE